MLEMQFVKLGLSESLSGFRSIGFFPPCTPCSRATSDSSGARSHEAVGSCCVRSRGTLGPDCVRSCGNLPLLLLLGSSCEACLSSNLTFFSSPGM